MADQSNPQTAGTNGHLWGLRSREWADIQEGQFGAAYEAVLDRLEVGPGTRCLDAGCGSGMAARLAADRGARVSGIDASSALLEIARERLPEADLQTGDLEELPWPTDTFDVVTSFNSFQYAGNPGAALAEAGRVAQPEGYIAIMTWGEPAGMPAAAIVAALKPLMPPPPPGAPGPFALSAEDRLRAFAQDAGLSPLDIFDVDSPWVYPDLQTALSGLRSSGVAARAIDNSSETAVDAAHEAALADFRQPDGSYMIGATCRILVASPAN